MKDVREILRSTKMEQFEAGKNLESRSDLEADEENHRSKVLD